MFVFTYQAQNELNLVSKHARKRNETKKKTERLHEQL